MRVKPAVYAGAALLIAALSLYLGTVCPTVYVGDTGELVSAAYALGIPHPPGYPLFCLAGKTLTFLPAGNIAFRVNLLAVLTAAMAVLVLFILSKRAFKASGWLQVLLLLLVSVTAGTSRVFWNQSGMAKGSLYTMTVLLLLSSVYFLERWKESGKDKYFSAAAFLAGLSVVSHQTSIVFLPAFLVYAAHVSIKRKPFLRMFLKGGVWFVLALCAFFYLMLRASAYPAVNCGNPSTFAGMFQHIFRLQYGGLAKAPWSLRLFGQELAACFSILNTQLPAAAICLPFIGLIVFFREKASLALLSLILSAGLVFGLMLGTVYDVTAAMLEAASVFMIPAYFFLWLWAYPGAKSLFKSENPKFLRILAVALLLCALVFNVCFNPGYIDKSSNRLAEKYAVDTLRSCPANAVVCMSEDSPMYQILYLQTVNGARPDVRILDETGTAFRTVLAESDTGVVFKGEVLKRAAEYVQGAFNTGMPVLCSAESGLINAGKLGKVPSGLLYLLKVQNGSYLPKADFWAGCSIPEPPAESDVFNRDMYARYHFMKAESLYESGDKKGFTAEMEKARDISPDMDWIRSEMAIIYGNRGFAKESLAAYESAARLYRYSSERRNNLANAYLAAGRTADAIKELEAACALDNNLAAARHNLGNAYLAAGKREAARAAYDKAAQLGQAESLDALNNLAGDLEKKGQKEEALQEYIRILSINKGYVFAWINAGNIFYGENKLDDAVRFYSNAVAVRPDYPEGYFNLGVAYYKKGDLASAKQLWLKTLQMAPAHAGALNAIKLVK